MDVVSQLGESHHPQDIWYKVPSYLEIFVTTASTSGVAESQNRYSQLPC